MVAVPSLEVARQVLQVQDNFFSNHPATIAISYLTNIGHADRHGLHSITTVLSSTKCGSFVS